jgi:diguanylate cyclase (GGDEF)-like protein
MILFVLVSSLSMVSIRELQGQARVVNYVGIVRGATQKLIKEELMNVHNDTLIMRLSSIVENLLTGEGAHGLVRLPDGTYLNLMRRVQAHWSELKEEIYRVRQGEGPKKLFDSSQEYFDLVNDTVFAAEAYSESQISRIMSLLMAINATFAVMLFIGAVFVIRGIASSKRVSTLGKIAFIDSLTQIDNRASCERMIKKIKEPAFTASTSSKTAVVMFDMNNLKTANDTLGHKVGDRMIFRFAQIVKNVTTPYGFVGRYGGDEFITILEKTSLHSVTEYLEKLKAAVDAHNDQVLSKLEKLSYSAGFCLGNLKDISLDDMIYEADRLMYENKHRLRKPQAGN